MDSTTSNTVCHNSSSSSIGCRSSGSSNHCSDSNDSDKTNDDFSSSSWEDDDDYDEIDGDSDADSSSSVSSVAATTNDCTNNDDDDNDDKRRGSVPRRWAVLGDSNASLLLSLLLLLAALLWSYSLDDRRHDTSTGSRSGKRATTTRGDSATRSGFYNGSLGPVPQHVYPAIIYDSTARDDDEDDGNGPVVATTVSNNSSSGGGGGGNSSGDGVKNKNKKNNNIGNDAKQDKTTITTQSMRREYVRDGVIAVRGLIDEELMARLLEESDGFLQQPLTKKRKQKGTNQQKTQFLTVNHSPMFRPPYPAVDAVPGDNHENHRSDIGSNDNNNNNATTNTRAKTQRIKTNAFLNVSLFSKVPRVAAELYFAEINHKNTNHDDNNSKKDIDSDNFCNHDDTNNNGDNVHDTSMRVFRDIFLAKDDNPYICGWHVDDSGFWPATGEFSGVNAWIALDDMPGDTIGGGFTVSVGSHAAEWREEAYLVTGSIASRRAIEKHNKTNGGYASARDMMENRTGHGTCNIRQSAPHLYRRLEETKRIYGGIQRGDVLFHTRWLFHRTIPFQEYNDTNHRNDRNGNNNNNNNKREETSDNEEQEPQQPSYYRRYSIRYGPGTSIITPGYGIELSVLYDPENGGRTANEICCSLHYNDYYQYNNDSSIKHNNSSSSGDNNHNNIPYNNCSCWYPQSYPIVNHNELIGPSFHDLVHTKMPVAERIRTERKKELTSYMKHYAK